MVDVKTEIIIERKIDDVASYATNPENAPEWYDNIKMAEWRSEPKMEIGSKVAFIAHFLGRKLAYTYEFIEFIPNHKLVMKTAQGPFPMQTSYTFRETDSGSTIMTLQNKGIPKGFSKIMAPFMVKMMKKANEKDLLKIKNILESE